MRPSITFVIPAYNAAETLGETLASVLAQRREDWSAIVVDDGSTDGTSDIARSARDPRVRVYRQENRGLGASRNAGLERTESEAVCFLDADDLIEPDYAGVMLAGFGRENDLVACAYRMVGPGGWDEDLGWTIRPGAQDCQIDLMIEVNPFAVGAVTMRRSAPARLGLGGPLFNPALRVHEDWDLWLRLTGAGARWGPIVPEPLFLYRLRANSMTSDLGVMWRDGLELIERAGVDAALKPAALRRWTVRNLARAIARGHTALVRTMIDAVGDLGADDAPLLAGSLRWAFCQQERVGPDRVGDRAGGWRARLTGMLRNEPVGDEVLARVSWEPDRWARAAAAVLAVMKPGDVPVVYGLGRNGRALLEALSRAGDGAVAWIDDHVAAEVMAGVRAERLGIESLGARHLVIVTPEERAGIVRRLAAAGVRRVETVESLLGG